VNVVVVGAAVVERDGCFLITKRQTGVHLAGYWEFPGGKCHPGETIVACVARELREELDVEVLAGNERFVTTHVYPDRTVELHFVDCTLVGDPRPLLGQDMQWVPRDQLAQLPFPPADVELIRFLTVGSLG
jgi:mutator protein MutT